MEGHQEGAEVGTTGIRLNYDTVDAPELANTSYIRRVATGFSQGAFGAPTALSRRRIMASESRMA